jgi:hypothetical protein
MTERPRFGCFLQKGRVFGAKKQKKESQGGGALTHIQQTAATRARRFFSLFSFFPGGVSWGEAGGVRPVVFFHPFFFFFFESST